MNPSLPANHLCTFTLIGNLVATPDIRYTANPVMAICEFTVASHSRWFDKVTNKYKEWTHYHKIQAIGSVVEQGLIGCQKGDILLMKGCLVTEKKSGKIILQADFIERFNKGFSPEINQLYLTGEIASNVQLINTQQDKSMAEFSVTSCFQLLSPINQTKKHSVITIPVHCWGKQATYMAEHANQHKNILIVGKLSYLNNIDKSLFIEAKQVTLLNALK